MMHEERPSPPQESRESESFREALALLTEARQVLESEGRERAISLLPQLYDCIYNLNRRDKEIDTDLLDTWNPSGYVTQEEFNILSYQRKLLSNQIGILTASGEIRHDLNIIEEPPQ